MVDRPLEVTYCSQDILDQFFSSSSHLLENYFEVCDSFKSALEHSSNTDSPLLDFKPLWAIRRSLQQQFQRGNKCVQIVVKSAHMVNKLNTSDEDDVDEGNINDEEGENIREDEGDKHRTMGYIKCKPSI